VCVRACVRACVRVCVCESYWKTGKSSKLCMIGLNSYIDLKVFGEYETLYRSACL